MMKLREPEELSSSFGKKFKLVIDPMIAVPAVLILIASLIALFSVVYHPVAFEINPDIASNFSNPFVKHLIWGILGIFGMSLFAFIDVDIFRKKSFGIYLFGILLLILVLVIGEKVRNIRAWLSLGVITFQPSELVKVILIISLASFLSNEKRTDNPVVSLILAGILVGIPALLVLKQPDMGTVIVYLSLLLTMPFAAGLPARYMILIVLSIILAAIRILVGIASAHPGVLGAEELPAILIAPSFINRISIVMLLLGIVVFTAMKYFRVRNAFCVFLYLILPVLSIAATFPFVDHLKDYQKTRLLSFIAPQLDPKGSGYNIIQSQIAFGSGRLFGKGLKGATQSSLGFLPERQTDFIFSVIGEVFGFAGAFIVITAFIFLCIRILIIAINARDKFSGLIAVGAFTILFTHIVVNIGMAIGIFPVMGIPLPLASYGGTALVSVLLMLGMVLSVERMYKRI